MHTDENIMPKNKNVWSSWNSFVDKKDLSKINGSDISDETIDEMEDSTDFDNIKNNSNYCCK